jgi:hypothetical protein
MTTTFRTRRVPTIVWSAPKYGSMAAQHEGRSSAWAVLKYGCTVRRKGGKPSLGWTRSGKHLFRPDLLAERSEANATCSTRIQSPQRMYGKSISCDQSTVPQLLYNNNTEELSVVLGSTVHSTYHISVFPTSGTGMSYQISASRAWSSTPASPSHAHSHSASRLLSQWPVGSSPP